MLNPDNSCPLLFKAFSIVGDGLVTSLKAVDYCLHFENGNIAAVIKNTECSSAVCFIKG